LEGIAGEANLPYIVRMSSKAEERVEL